MEASNLKTESLPEEKNVEEDSENGIKYIGHPIRCVSHNQGGRGDRSLLPG